MTFLLVLRCLLIHHSLLHSLDILAVLGPLLLAVVRIVLPDLLPSAKGNFLVAFLFLGSIRDQGLRLPCLLDLCKDFVEVNIVIWLCRLRGQGGLL